MGEELEGEGGANLLDDGASFDDFLEEVSLFSGGAGGAGEGVVDQEIERAFPVFVVEIFDLSDDLRCELGAVNGLGVQAVFFTICDLLKVVLIEAHIWQLREFLEAREGLSKGCLERLKISHPLRMENRMEWR